MEKEIRKWLYFNWKTCKKIPLNIGENNNLNEKNTTIFTGNFPKYNDLDDILQKLILNKK